MATDTVTIGQFVEENGITIKSVPTDHNRNMADSANIDHWQVTLVRRTYTQPGTFVNPQSGSIRNGKEHSRRMTLTFSKGYGHHGAEPTATEVLDCLASDAAGIDNAVSFEDWCSEYGYDTDSRKAEKTFKACEHEATRLKTFLGEDLYQQLLYWTERE
jgi:hypothetical protein